jgi:hypothetical protein
MYQTQTTQKQHPKFRFSKNAASKKKTVHKHYRRAIEILGFYPQYSLRSQNNSLNKIVASHNQLRAEHGFSS